MSSAIDIRPDHLEIVQKILTQYLPKDVRVWAFGSRAKWTAKDFSDLDIAIEHKKGGKISPELLTQLKDAFEESIIPYKIDVVDWHSITESFRKIIEQDRVELPKAKGSDWREVKLGDVCNINFTRRSKNWKFEKMLYIDISSVGEGMFIEQPKEILSDDAPSRAQRLLEDGDTIVSTVRPNRRSMLFLRNAKPNMVASTGFAVLRAKPEKLDQRFLYFTVFDKAFTAYLESKAEGSAYPAVNPSVFDSAPVNIPPLQEQKEIAQILSALDDKIELNNKMNETLEATAQALFKSWFVDFEPVKAKMEGSTPEGLTTDLAALFPDKLIDSPLGQTPQGWEVKEIADCCVQVMNGSTPSRKEPEYWQNGNIPWLVSGEVRQTIILEPENRITELGFRKSSVKLVPKLSTVVALYGATAGQVSLIASEMTTNQAICSLVPKEFYKFYNYLHISTKVKYLEQQARGSAQQNLSKGIVEKTRIISPKNEILQCFEGMVTPLFARWIENLKENQNLGRLRDTLLPKLISGELRVGDAASKIKEAV